MRHSSATPSGSTGAGLTTTVLPQASAGPILPAQLVIGKLNGVMHATTPIGSRTTTPAATPRRPDRAARGGSASSHRRARQLGVLRQAQRDGAHLLRLGDRPHRAGLGDGQVDEARHLASNCSAALRSRAPRSAPLMRGHGPRSNAVARGARRRAAPARPSTPARSPPVSSVAGLVIW